MLFRRFCCLSAVLMSLVWMPGCGKKDEGAGARPEAAPPAVPRETAAATAQSEGAGEGTAARGMPQLTPEMEGAALSVEVAVPNGPARVHVGAMLRAEDLGMRAECTRRFAAVLLPDFDEKALRAPGCQLRVLRRKFDAKGGPCVALMHGTLVYFEPGSHLALVRFPETFACRLDAGLAVEKNEGAGAGALLGALHVQRGLPLAAGQGLKSATSLPESVYKMVPGTLEVALAAPVVQPGGLLAVAGNTAARPGAWLPGVASVPVLSAEGRLAGFAVRKTGASDAWEMRPGVVLPEPGALPVDGPRFVPLGAVTGRPDKVGLTTVMVKGELYDPDREFERCRVVLKAVPSRDVPAVADAQADQPALESAEPPTTGHLAADGTLLFALRPPAAGTAQEMLLVQVVLERPGAAAVFHSAPFLLAASWSGRTAFFSVQGLQTLLGVPSLPEAGSLVVEVPATAGGDAAAAAVAVARGAGVELSTESPILYGVPAREGREVLLRLEGAPFWKRLSLAEGKWLPLPVPEAELQMCRLAGNREAIFVLHTGLQELRRYDAEGLQLEKKVALPEGRACRDIAAGCLSAEGPLAVVADQGVLAYGARDLAPGAFAAVRGTDEVKQAADPFFHLASGDGLAVWSLSWSEKNLDTPSFFQYADALQGYAYGSHEMGGLPAAGRAWRWAGPDYGLWAPGTWVGNLFEKQRMRHGQPVADVKMYVPPSGSSWGPLAGCPHLVVLSRLEGGGHHPRMGSMAAAVGAAGRSQPNVPSCTFVAYGAAEPWARVETPELEALSFEQRKHPALRVWLDARALKFAVWHRPQAVMLHTLEKEQMLPPQAPVLATYPDCHVAPGGDFRFKPELVGAASTAGAAAPVVSLVDAPEGMTVGADGTLSWHAPAVNALRHADFAVKVEEAGTQRACELWMRLEVDDLPQVLALAPVQGAAKKGADDRSRSLHGSARLAQKEEARAAALAGRKALPLGSRFYASETPILEVLPGLDDYLCLRLADKTLALFSVKEWRVAGSLRLEDSMTAFPAGDTVLVHDGLQQTLTRYSLPDFKPVLRQPLPPACQLRGLAVGLTAAGPVTLLLEDSGAGRAFGFAKMPVQQQQRRTALEILDKQTLTPGAKWAAYRPAGKDDFWLNMESSRLQNEEHPVQLPASHDGRLVRLNQYMLMVTPAFTSECDLTPPGVLPASESREGGRPVMDRVFTSGRMELNKLVSGFGKQESPQGSRCGNYLTDVEMDYGEMRLNLYATDDGRPLLDLECVGAYEFNDGPRSKESLKARVMPLGEKNLLTTLSLNGRLLQVTHVDLAAVLKTLNPGAAYVTTRPFPVVMEGRTLEYRMALSDPAAAGSYELVDKIPGAAVNNLGVFTYKAPDKLDRPTLVRAAVLIRLKNGQSAVHKFPIYVIPPPPALSGKKGK